MRLVLRATAEADLRAIARYSLEEWGEEQADQYVSELLAYLDSVAQGHRHQRLYTSGSGVVYLESKFRSYFIFSRPTKDALTIFRILHERRDVLRHLA